MQKLLIKFIYFLLRFVKTEIASFDAFNTSMRKLAKDKYYSIKIEKTVYDGRILEFKFSSYIEDTTWLHGKTPQEVLEKQENYHKKDIDTKIKTIID